MSRALNERIKRFQLLKNKSEIEAPEVNRGARAFVEGPMPCSAVQCWLYFGDGVGGVVMCNVRLDAC